MSTIDLNTSYSLMLHKVKNGISLACIGFGIRLISRLLAEIPDVCERLHWPTISTLARAKVSLVQMEVERFT